MLLLTEASHLIPCNQTHVDTRPKKKETIEYRTTGKHEFLDWDRNVHVPGDPPFQLAHWPFCANLNHKNTRLHEFNSHIPNIEAELTAIVCSLLVPKTLTFTSTIISEPPLFDLQEAMFS